MCVLLKLPITYRDLLLVGLPAAAATVAVAACGFYISESQRVSTGCYRGKGFVNFLEGGCRNVQADSRTFGRFRAGRASDTGGENGGPMPQCNRFIDAGRGAVPIIAQDEPGLFGNDQPAGRLDRRRLLGNCRGPTAQRGD